MMRSFTAARGPDTPDEVWLVEHPPVFTLGRAARLEHVRAPGTIAVARTERGGQVTYHGPGQAVCYVLVDLRRAGIRVRDFVARIEDATISLLGEYGIDAVRRSGAPGVYVRSSDAAAGESDARDGRSGAGDVAGAKIASIGIRITDGCSWHGVALNVAMDLEPFGRIDPCGYPGLAVTDMRSCLSAPADYDEISGRFASLLAAAFASDSSPDSSPVLRR